MRKKSSQQHRLESSDQSTSPAARCDCPSSLLNSKFSIFNFQFAICNLQLPTSGPHHRSKKAFTLVEVLITLALVVLIAAVAWIGVQRPLAQQRLRAAADAVRTEWCRARIDAMKSSHAYAFRYAVNGDHYQLGPQEDPALPVAELAIALEDESWEDDPLPPLEEKSLPPGIRFASEGGGLPPEGPQGDGAVTAAGDGWSDPIFFYADGSTSDARLVLAGGGRMALQLTLRGATGSVTVGDVTTIP